MMPAIHELVAEQARLRPAAPAISADTVTVSYQELDQWSDRIAGRLLARGVRPGGTVAVAMGRSVSYPAAVLGILKAGCAYVPLDPGYPAERRELILQVSGAQAVMTASGARQPGSGLLTIEVPGLSDAGPAGVDLPAVSADDLAYVIFTSGSMGRPKGVMVEHRQVVSLVRLDERLRVQPGQRVALLAPVAFDASTFELWNTLGHGGELVVFGHGTDSVAELGERLRTSRPDWLFLTTGLFHLLAEYDVSALDAAGTVITGGDVLSPRHIRAAAERGTVRVFAAYGPTETTTFASLHEVVAGQVPDRVPIGRPLAGTTMSVLDEAGHSVAAGEIGELYIGGAGVARGYAGAAASDDERFQPDPAADGTNARRYRTGDLVRELPGGEFEFHGRIDRQVKIRGFRVEPGEIEIALLGHPDVAAAVVAAVKDGSGIARLVAYLAATQGADPRVPDLREWLGERLPAFMQPSTFVMLERFPLDPNGKPDRQALPHPWAARHELPDLPAFRPAATATERALASAWAECLGLDIVGLDDDFYQLGGDSLHSVDLLARLRRDGIEVSALVFFRNPTVAGLAAAVGDTGPEPIQSTVERSMVP